jgi:hypothetical protein
MSMLDESDDPRLPDSLTQELRQIYRTAVNPPSAEVDRLLTSGVRAHLLRSRRLRLWISAAATVAAVVLIAIVLIARPDHRASATATAVEDVNGDGVVDIRDALLLQQQIDRGNVKAHDVNHDGLTDHADVDAIAQRAVRLPPMERGAVR